MSLGYVIRRLLGAIPLLLGISLILFTIIHLAPGGPLDMYLENPAVSPEALEQIAKAYGLRLEGTSTSNCTKFYTLT